MRHKFSVAVLALALLAPATAMAATIDASLIPDGTYTVKVERVIDSKHMLVTMDAQRREIADGGLYIEDNRIVAVGPTSLAPGSVNRIPATTPPTFTVKFQNQGDNDEHNVKASVRIAGAGRPIPASKTVPQARQKITVMRAIGKPTPGCCDFICG